MNKILFLDTLATGINPERCSIYRIGGIICNETSSGLEEVVRFDLCARPNPGTRIVDNSLWVGGMTRAKLAYLPEQKKAFDQFMEIIESSINIRNPKDKFFLAGFNTSGFDMPHLRQWFMINKNERFRDCFYMQTLDLMNMTAFTLMNEREGMSDFYLETTAKMFGVTPVHSEIYSPLDNVETCIEIYLKLKGRLMRGHQLQYKKVRDIVKNHKF